MKPQRGKTPRKRTASSPREYEPVEVYCRIRPLDNPEDSVCIKAISIDTVELVPPEYQFKFCHVFDEYASQKAVFEYVSLPLVEDLVFGRNGLLFTYGITSSGKTYTMTGTPQDPGILPRCLDVLFNSIQDLQAKKYVFRPDKLNGFEVQSEADAMLERQRRDIMPGLTTPRTPYEKPDVPENERVRDQTRIDDVDEDNNYAVFVSYIEIYNNYIYDLLEELPYDPITGYKPPQSKILRTDNSDNMYVHNCVEIEVKTTEEAFEVFYKGQKRRKVAHTSLNAESSRSHSVFNIRLVQAPLDTRGEEVVQDPEKIYISQLSLVDLAGSERTNRTRNAGDRLREAGNINQSLMTLRSCLELLRENQKSGANKMVPYRDSRLTHLFKNYFDGDGKVRMIVCVNPRADEYEETIHVMKFAEMSQEVLVTRSQQVNFNTGFTPGRRRMHQQYAEKMERQPEIPLTPLLPPLSCSLGPPFPLLELVQPTDDKTLANLSMCLDERMKRRQVLLQDFQQRAERFRSHLVEFERNYERMGGKTTELEAALAQEKAARLRIESRMRAAERKAEESIRRVKDLEKENQALTLKVQDKNWKIQVEKTEKERLKSDFQTRLNMNNKQWEKNLEKIKLQVEAEAEAQLEEKERKLDILRDIVNNDETPRKAPRPAPKPRTYTTPGVSIQSARSEVDMSSIGAVRSKVTRNATTPGVPVNRIPAAKSMYNLNQVAATSASAKKAPVPYNTRYHRRSKSSSSAADIWLDHKPAGSVDTNTVLQPKLGKKRSVSKLEIRDTRDVSKYCLTHQEQDSNDELVTKIIKGDVIPTAAGGTAVVFKDVEILKQTSPGSRKRRSSGPPSVPAPEEWTDVETRCSIAIEGHSKRNKRSDV
ncbi:kinesin-like protein KIF23 isoform X2 [Pomacea canaliculata]|uniref:kinesin-like protein KIF23 isoform X2 n=1 Tax=Pomacea canaliculata TaxID=400727 RepID=UPI000D72544D|nr:kinesin-like protein KIF23 isoform X2 [Pomacea canaliculata]